MTETVKKRRGLGKNRLDILLGSTNLPLENKVKDETDNSALKLVPIKSIQPGKHQARRSINPASIEELAQSIRKQGVLQPIVLREVDINQYEILAGERRWHASQQAGLDNIPAIIKNISDEDAMAVGLIENMQRENLNAIEEALGIKRLLEEFSLTHQEIADALGKSRSAISNLQRLLNLNDDVKTLVENGDIEAGHAKVLLALSGSQQSEMAKVVIDKELSVRDTEKQVRKSLDNNSVINSDETVKLTTATSNPNIDKLMQQLASHINSKVSIKAGKNGKGKLVINYKNTDELESILQNISQ